MAVEGVIDRKPGHFWSPSLLPGGDSVGACVWAFDEDVVDADDVEFDVMAGLLTVAFGEVFDAVDARMSV